MAIKRKRRREFELSTGALSDIMFFLLLFFLILSTLANPNVIKVPLPESKNSQKTTKSHLTLSVQYQNGKYTYCFDKDIKHQIVDDEEELKNQMVIRTKANHDNIILLRFDKHAQAQKLVDLLAIAAGVNVELRVNTTLIY